MAEKRGRYALTTDNRITLCTAKPEDVGKGRCNHIDHQGLTEEPAQFLKRVEQTHEIKGIDGIEEPKKNSLFNFRDENNKPRDVHVTIKPYRMSEEDKENSYQIESKLDFDKNLNKPAFIHTDIPIWNEMDMVAFAQQDNCPLRKKDIMDVVTNEQEIIVETNDPNWILGKIVTPYRAKLLKEAHDKGELEGVQSGSGVENMNKVAKYYGFEATKDIYVLPYYMRSGTDAEDSPITATYKGMFRQRNQPDRMEEHYLGLLNNRALDKYKQRTVAGGYARPSLADEFAGKGGIFRKYITGRAVPYSGRAVIEPTTDVKYGELMIPAAGAIDMYKPTIISQLELEGKTDQEIEEFISDFRGNHIPNHRVKELDDLLRKANVRVIFNRQPSSQTANTQSMRPRVWGNRAIGMNPLYDAMCGGDHDGDQSNIYAINNSSLSDTLDRSMGARENINTKIGRARDKAQNLPSKDSLFGIMSILQQRTK